MDIRTNGEAYILSVIFKTERKKKEPTSQIYRRLTKNKRGV